MAREEKGLKSFSPVERRGGTWPLIFYSLHRLMTIIKSTGSGKDDVPILSQTKEALGERVLLELNRVAT